MILLFQKLNNWTIRQDYKKIDIFLYKMYKRTGKKGDSGINFLGSQ
ncbi:hypothetical protein HMPREF0083_03218 [Aneurinibacillus aneurinilyticus ATCC 12856]|uniref:Uncharacterized protein n=1 Tax=Aneurinibacillus aneurinilyticus ATCC 12856 TaxID=649747 RepID=U1YD52_ANEAE|nr:hypothetical protein HMPREF0083_03218 [Aneurinibacillus aneurinilyticus ATCC 12856]